MWAPANSSCSTAGSGGSVGTRLAGIGCLVSVSVAADGDGPHLVLDVAGPWGMVHHDAPGHGLQVGQQVLRAPDHPHVGALQRSCSMAGSRLHIGKDHHRNDEHLVTWSSGGSRCANPLRRRRPAVEGWTLASSPPSGARRNHWTLSRVYWPPLTSMANRPVFSSQRAKSVRWGGRGRPTRRGRGRWHCCRRERQRRRLRPGAWGRCGVQCGNCSGVDDHWISLPILGLCLVGSI